MVCFRLCFRFSLLAAFLMAQVSYASSNITAKVLYVGTYGSSSFFINTDHAIDEPGCNGSTRIDLPASHPELKNWLAIAMAALTSGKSIMFKTNGCYQPFPAVNMINPTMSTAGDSLSFLLLTN